MSQAALGDNVEVILTRAEHSSSIKFNDPDTGGQRIYPGGEPAGFIVKLVDEGITLYHAAQQGEGKGDVAHGKKLSGKDATGSRIGSP